MDENTESFEDVIEALKIDAKGLMCLVQVLWLSMDTRLPNFFNRKADIKSLISTAGFVLAALGGPEIRPENLDVGVALLANWPNGAKEFHISFFCEKQKSIVICIKAKLEREKEKLIGSHDEESLKRKTIIERALARIGPLVEDFQSNIVEDPPITSMGIRRRA